MKNMFKKFGTIIIALLSIAIIILLLIILKLFKKEEKSEEVLIPVEVVSPIRGDLLKTYQISGYIESENMVTILPKISGSLLSLTVNVGDQVQEGELIGIVDSESYGLQLKQAEAAYFASKSTFDRISKLFKAQAASQQNYDEAKSKYDAYKSQYELALLQFNYTKISSPINGVVLQKHTQVGSLVAPQVPIVTIGDLDNLIVNTKIPEQYYYIFIKKQNNFKIQIDIPALHIAGVDASIKTISPYISAETKNFNVTCSIGEYVEGLRPGMYIYTTFILEEKKDIYYLPFDVLISDKILWYVNEKNFASSLEITPDYYNDDYFEIPPEYTKTPFIIDGQHFLRENQKIRIINSDSSGDI